MKPLHKTLRMKNMAAISNTNKIIPFYTVKADGALHYLLPIRILVIYINFTHRGIAIKVENGKC